MASWPTSCITKGDIGVFPTSKAPSYIPVLCPDSQFTVLHRARESGGWSLALDERRQAFSLVPSWDQLQPEFTKSG